MVGGGRVADLDQAAGALDAGDAGILLAFDEASGEFLWQHFSAKLATGRVNDWPYQGVCSSPHVEGDRLYYVSNRGEIVALDTAENLKLEHGQRSVKVRRREESGVAEESYALDDPAVGEQLRTAVQSEGLMTIHTEESTLENIFVEMTGRTLEA